MIVRNEGKRLNSSEMRSDVRRKPAVGEDESEMKEREQEARDE